MTLSLWVSLTSSWAQVGLTGQFETDFEEGLPPGSQVYGDAMVVDGALQLTPPELSRIGSWIIDDFNEGHPVTRFTARFDALAWHGDGADGFSFNLAHDLPDLPFWEEGVGTGLTVSFDTFDNGGGEAPAIDVKVGGQFIARWPGPVRTGKTPVPVRIELHPDGTLDVDYAGQQIFSGLQTGYDPLPGRFGFSARTGGLFDEHRIDNVSINLFNSSGPPIIVLQPRSQIVTEQELVTFRVGADGSAPHTFQWYVNGSAIPGATSSIYRIVATLAEDSGNYSCQVVNHEGLVVSEAATLTVVPDTIQPTVESVSGGPTFRRLTVRFSERVSAASANDPFAYTVSGLLVDDATLQADGRTVLLQTSPQTQGAPYGLQVDNVQDLAAFPNTVDPTIPYYFTAWLIHEGLVQVSIYSDLAPGNALSLLTSSPKFPDQPDLVFLTNKFTSVRDYADLYGARVAGFFSLPSDMGSGAAVATFYAAGDDEFAVNLSPDDDPENAGRIIDGLTCCQPLSAHPSAPQSVVAGQKRYLEGLVKEGGGGDFLDVAVAIGPGAPNTNAPTGPIPSRFLSTAANPDTAGALMITEHPAPAVGSAGHGSTFRVRAITAQDRPPFIQWQAGRNGVFTNVAGALGATYTTPPLRLSDSGQSFRAVLQVPGRVVTSIAALLLVTPDRRPPVLLSAASVNSLRANLLFDEALAPETAILPENYAVSGANVIQAILRSDQRSVELWLDEHVSFFTVSVNNVTDLAGNPIEPNSIVQGPVWAESTSIGSQFEANNAFSAVPGRVDVIAGGADIWGTADSFHFVHQIHSGDFDVQVKVEHLEAANTWSKAGLMVRSELTANSKTLHAYTTPLYPSGAGVFEAGYRPNTGGATVDWELNRPSTSLPNAWVRLRRVRDNFSAFHSSDGQTWTEYANLSGGAGVELFNETVFLGLATTAQAETGTTRARYSNFSFLSTPSIISQPESQTVDPGDSVVLSVNAGGISSLRYQWRLNGVNIPGATNRFLALFDSTPKDSGRYTVVVVGPTSLVESDPAVVVVRSEPFSFQNFFGTGPVLAGEVGVGSGNNSNATLEVNEPIHANRTGGSSVWASWVAPFDGPVTFSTRGSSFDTLLAVYLGETLTELAPVASDDDRGGFGTSQVIFNAVSGAKYHLAIDGLRGAQGQIVLCWELRFGPAVPQILTQPRNAVVTVGEPVSFFVEVENASRIEWLLNGIVIPGAQGPSFAISAVGFADVGLYVARVYGSDGESFVDSRPAWIEVGPFPGALSYDKFESLFDRVDEAGRGGSNPSVGIPVAAGSTVSQALNNHNSTTQSGEPNHCGRLTAATRWYGPLFTSTNGLTFEIDTTGSAINTILASYVGDDLLSVTLIDCAVGPGANSVIRFPATPGTLYDIAVDGTEGSTGQIRLNYRLGAEPVWTSVPTDQLVMPGAAVELAAAALGVPDPVYQWYTNGVAVPGATDRAFRISSAQSVHTGFYSVVASNFMGTATSEVILVVGTPFDFQFQETETNGARTLVVIGPSDVLATQPYVIEASFDFGFWDPIWTNATPEIRTNFIDADSLFYPHRFYRAVPAFP